MATQEDEYNQANCLALCMEMVIGLHCMGVRASYQPSLLLY